MSNKIVPFGKYKGQPVEVLQADPEYSDWLAQQQWFRERFADLFNLLAAGRAPTETPEHNMMQARFLDNGYALQFILKMYKPAILDSADRMHRLMISHENELVTSAWQDVVWKVLEEMVSKMRVEKKAVDDRVARRRIPSGIDSNGKQHYKTLALYLDKDDNDYIAWKTLDERMSAICKLSWDRKKITEIHVSEFLDEIPRRGTPLSVPEVVFDEIKIGFCREFEVDGADITLGVTASWQEKSVFGRASNIELKPTVGDDFPSILRTIKTRMIRKPSVGNSFWRYESREWDFYLIVGEYTGVGATWEQVVSMFAASRITCLFERDISTPLSSGKGGNADVVSS